MKKITLVACMFAALGAFAQQNMPLYSASKAHTPAQKPKLDVRTLNSNSQSKLALGFTSAHYQLSWTDQLYNYLASGGLDVTDSLPFYTNPFFMDSTANLTASSTNYTIGLQRVGMVCDPKSPLFDPNFAGNQLLTPSTMYRLDTVFIGAFYTKLATKTDATTGDTLYIEVCWGDTLNAVWEHLVGTNTAISPKINPSTVQSGHHSFQKSNTNTLHFYHLLTAADTVTVNNPFAGLIVCPVPSATGSKTMGLNIPANNDFAVSFTFVPGAKSNYKNGDDVYDYDAAQSAQSNGIAMLYCTNYFMDQANYYNAPVDYFNWQQYEMAAKEGAPTVLDSTMLPETNSSYEVIYAITTTGNTGISTAVENSVNVAQNFPNPCSGYTYINYTLAKDEDVSLEVYDITGKLVTSLSQGHQYAGVNHSINLSTAGLQSGVYFYTLVTNNNRITKRMTVIN